MQKALIYREGYLEWVLSAEISFPMDFDLLGVISSVFLTSL